MAAPDFLTTASDRRIAYHYIKGKGPGIVFLGGFKSDMDGTKAIFIEKLCKSQGWAYLRFDYSGHGQSSGEFTDGCIGDWADDAFAVIDQITDGKQILVGSSMGGWISLLMTKRLPERIAGLVTIAAAPDFTEDGYWASFNEDTRRYLAEEGVVNVPSDYGDPYPITKKLIEEGRQHLVLRSSLELSFPTRFLQGEEDVDVPMETALRLFSHADGHDVQLTIVKEADHRFSTSSALGVLETALHSVQASL